ncbi:MAG: protein translocase subunit SecF [Alphaproteobacteria bacterium]|nr:protein translocase subunit SecF [Alphaproteobacteria bacterium]OJV46438.1 MAG: protein-export membrane protein SecF [Alphaproteobacteria bacterium 43-37]
MRSINFIPHNTNINFVGARFITLGLSILLVIVTLAGILIKGLNFGIDFKGGFSIVIRTEQPADVSALREKISGLGLGDHTLQGFGGPHDVLIRIQSQPGGEKAQQEALVKIKEGLGSGIEYRQIETVGPKAGDELIRNGITAVALAILAMLVYIWVRFDWQFSVCAILALVHDCFAILAMYCFLPFEFNITAIVAILTTAGYSINDTVVIYDRIRENIRKNKKMDLKTLINRSINETLSRTILTSSTTLISLTALYFFGGKVIAEFSLPIIIGIAVGTYSSICIAAVLLLYVGLRPQKSEAAAPELSPVP